MECYCPSYNIIRGSYTSTLNHTHNDFSNNLFFYTRSDLKKIIESYVEEMIYIENHITQLEVDNIRLLQHIYFFDRRCYLSNITHSNTINFIMTNYRQLKHILDRLLFMYNKNLEYIMTNKEKIYNIIRNINSLKLQDTLKRYSPNC